MFPLVDAHLHLDLNNILINKHWLINNQINAFIHNSVLLQDSLAIEKIAPQITRPGLLEGVFGIGIHPWFVHLYQPSHKQTTLYFEQMLQSNTKWILGEVGLDFGGKALASHSQQIAVFKLQLYLAQNFNRPIVIHNYKAQGEILALVKGSALPHRYLHGYRGSLAGIKPWLKAGFHLGIGAYILDQVDKWQGLKKYLPLEYLWVESDWPQKKPFQLIEVYKMLAKIYQIPLADLITQQQQKFKQVFNNFINPYD